MRFALRMAWRDSRSTRARLLLFSLAISAGVAALVAIGSLRENLARAIDQQARTLLGADLAVYSNRPFSNEVERELTAIGGTQAREVRFSTMAVFPDGRTRLVNLRAMRGDFPFYGALETDPPRVGRGWERHGSALLDASLVAQFGLKRGERVTIGGGTFEVAGALTKIPGEASAGASFAPRVYIPLDDLAPLHLLGQGSVARYIAYVAFENSATAQQTLGAIIPRLRELGVQIDTVEKRERNLGDSLANLYRFLNLVGFSSLLLGAVGMASGVQAHLQQKIRTGAILRCLGQTALGTAGIYFRQVVGMSIAGACAGGLVGIAIQRVVTMLLPRVLPIAIPADIAWRAAFEGVAVGAGTCVLFALPPLLRFRRVSPLRVLRAAGGACEDSKTHDPLLLVSYAILVVSIAGLAIWQAETWRRGIVWAVALFAAVAVFAGTARLLVVAMRRWSPTRLSFAWRHGISNLHRPGNRSTLLIVALGLGTFLLLVLQLTRGVLLDQFSALDRGNQPNLFLFDIQPDQQLAVAELVRSLGFRIVQQAPIVTMRLSKVKGEKAADILADPKRHAPEWELQREYRSTFRSNLVETEKLVAGKWIGHFEGKPGEPVPISLERELANDLRVRIGDELVWDVQGVPIRTRVASLRTVDWKRFQTNFFVVFPAGVLESAPAFYVMVTRAATPADSARLQSAVVSKFPNVSAIDLATVIQAVDSVLSKVALGIRVMSLFTIVTGLLVVATAITSGRYQRAEESTLLRALGASRRQIRQLLAAEYMVLGLVASVAAAVLALAASWALAAFLFKLPFTATAWPFLFALAATTSLTVAVGVLSSRGISDAPPLEVLRRETS